MSARIFGFKIFTSKGAARVDSGPVPTMSRPTAQDLLDFEYPPESPFSQHRTDNEFLTQD